MTLIQQLKMNKDCALNEANSSNRNLCYAVSDCMHRDSGAGTVGVSLVQAFPATGTTTSNEQNCETSIHL